MLDLLWLVIKDAFWSGIAAVGFAMLFNVPARMLVFCAAVGALGHATRTFLMEELNITIQTGTLVGATLVGFCSDYLARHYKIPSMTFSIPGVIPMVPGFFAYLTMIGLIEIADADATSGTEVLSAAVTNGVKTALILGALAAGIAAPKLLFHRPKPVV